MSIALKVLLGLIIVGAGAMVFNTFVMPNMLASLYFQENTVIEKSVIDNVKKSIVVMNAPLGLYSGLVLTEDGLVVSLNSVLNNKNVISGYIEGDQVSLKNLHTANDNVALLRITKSGLVGTKFADGTKIKAGEKVFLVAAASFYQDEWIVREGTITQTDGVVIKTNIEGSEQLSSAPLLNSAGELVGIVYIDSSNQTVAVPVSQIRLLTGL